MENLLIGLACFAAGLALAFWPRRHRGSYWVTFRPSGKQLRFNGIGKEQAKRQAKKVLNASADDGFTLRRI